MGTLQDKNLLAHARANRQRLTPLEAQLWARLSRSQLGGFKFRRQHVIDGAIVDFFCPAKGLIVEVDGDSHDEAHDRCRDERHKALGFATLRISNRDVRNNLDGVLDLIAGTLLALPDRWAGHPHPYPSPEGERR